MILRLKELSDDADKKEQIFSHFTECLMKRM